jgi:hypothetical protein
MVAQEPLTLCRDYDGTADNQLDRVGTTIATAFVFMMDNPGMVRLVAVIPSKNESNERKRYLLML